TKEQLQAMQESIELACTGANNLLWDEVNLIFKTAMSNNISSKQQRIPTSPARAFPQYDNNIKSAKVAIKKIRNNRIPYKLP
ncbi:18299_t:CDS:1, partial [Acaulospora morrowiae]